MCETGDAATTGGRPEPQPAFTADAHLVAGIDLGGSKMFGILADRTGTVLREHYVLHRPNGTPDDYLAALGALIEELAGVALEAGQQIRGVGVGVPGMVQTPEGIVRWAPSTGWREVQLQAILCERFSVPVLVENDLNLTALGELGFGAGRGRQHLVAVAIGTGIGAGIVIDGKLYRGAHQSAGEIGYLPPGVEYLGRRYEGFGALESLASGPGIAEQARRHMARQGLAPAMENLTARDVFLAARGGEVWARQVVAETVDYLSISMASICTLLDPEIIVLGGGVAQSADLLIEPMRRRLEGVVPVVPPIVASPLGGRATALGAILLVSNASQMAAPSSQFH